MRVGVLIDESSRLEGQALSEALTRTLGPEHSVVPVVLSQSDPQHTGPPGAGERSEAGRSTSTATELLKTMGLGRRSVPWQRRGNAATYPTSCGDPLAHADLLAAVRDAAVDVVVLPEFRSLSSQVLDVPRLGAWSIVYEPETIEVQGDAGIATSSSNGYIAKVMLIAVSADGEKCTVLDAARTKANLASPWSWTRGSR